MVLVGLLTGVLLGDDDPGASAEALETIEDSYFEPVESDRLEDASIRGMVGELRGRFDDRFSHYFDAGQLEDFNAATSGRFDGVGLSVTEVPRGLRVADVFPDSPAQAAEIKRGDLIVAVDGKSIEGVPSAVSTGRIKGPQGTEVELTVLPAGGGAERELALERADVRLPAVAGRMLTVDGRDVAHVRFASFSEGSHGELRQAIEGLERRGAEGLVLDLRGNGGGLLNEAVLSASVFVEEGTVVSTESRTQGDRSYEAVGDAIEPLPTVVLVDRDTASAAEILDRGARDLRPGDRSRHPHLRQGHLPGGDPADRRRRTRPDDRRVPDCRRDFDRRRGGKARRSGPRTICGPSRSTRRSIKHCGPSARRL